MPPLIIGPAGYDPVLGEMRTVNVNGGTAADYTFNSSEFTIGVAGLVSLKEVPGSKVNGPVPSVSSSFFSGRLVVSDGSASFNPVANIVSASGATVTLNPDTAYKVFATTQAVTLNANVPASGQWGLEGHIELFVAGTGYVVTGSNVVLANALEPDAVNNCTVRFHDGLAIISVEDHVAGYIVTVNAGTTAGSLYYGLATSTNEYIAVDASLNGQTLDLGGAVTNGEKHVVGNGYTETIVSGGINCTSKTTLSNLAANGVVVSSGTLTLGDVYIPNGATVAVSGGGLAIEKVTGDGTGVVDLGGTKVTLTGGTAYASGCTFTGGSRGIDLQISASVKLEGCRVESNNGAAPGGVYVGPSCVLNAKNTAIVKNTVHDFRVVEGIVNCDGCDIGIAILVNNGKFNLTGSNTLTGSGQILGATDENNGSVIISSGAIVDLTGNSNATPIAPCGGVTFAEGGATVLTGGTTGVVDAQYMLGGMTVPSIGNTNVVNLNNTIVNVPQGVQAIVSGCTITGGSASMGGAFYTFGNLELDNVTLTKNNGFGTVFVQTVGTANLTSCTCTSNGYDMIALGSAKLTDCDVEQLAVWGGTIGFSGSNSIEKRVIYTGDSPGTVVISSGAIVDITGTPFNPAIAPGGGVIVDGGCTVINSAGASVSIAGGTYTQINNDGTTE